MVSSIETIINPQFLLDDDDLSESAGPLVSWSTTVNPYQLIPTTSASRSGTVFARSERRVELTEKNQIDEKNGRDESD